MFVVAAADDGVVIVVVVVANHPRCLISFRLVFYMHRQNSKVTEKILIIRLLLLLLLLLFLLLFVSKFSVVFDLIDRAQRITDISFTSRTSNTQIGLSIRKELFVSASADFLENMDTLFRN